MIKSPWVINPTWLPQRILSYFSQTQHNQCHQSGNNRMKYFRLLWWFNANAYFVSGWWLCVDESFISDVLKTCLHLHSKEVCIATFHYLQHRSIGKGKHWLLQLIILKSPSINLNVLLFSLLHHLQLLRKYPGT